MPINGCCATVILATHNNNDQHHDNVPAEREWAPIAYGAGRLSSAVTSLSSSISFT